MATTIAPAVLPRRPLGATGLSVSVLGFGASPLGSVFEAIDEEEGVRAVHEAVRQGINFFDVSPCAHAGASGTPLTRAQFLRPDARGDGAGARAACAAA